MTQTGPSLMFNSRFLYHSQSPLIVTLESNWHGADDEVKKSHSLCLHHPWMDRGTYDRLLQMSMKDMITNSEAKEIEA